MPIIIFTLLLSFFSFAQHAEQPQAESTTDLRNQTLIFHIEEVKSGRIFRLERTPALSHFLLRSHKGEKSIQKIDSKVATHLDMEFAGRFLKTMYEIPSAPGKCEVTLRLNFKGEGQEICQKDEKKTQEIVTFIEALNQRF